MNRHTKNRSFWSHLRRCLLILVFTSLVDHRATAFHDDGFTFALTTARRLADSEKPSAKETTKEACQEADVCQMCTFSDQKSIPACKQTGRMQKFECVISSDEEGEVLEKRTEIRSCKKTRADEEFGMVRLQMLCLVVGSLAFVSVRKQKRISASLFDQRKQGISQPPKSRTRRNSDAVEEEEIEFSTMTNQETVPLVDTSNSMLEVI